MSQRNPPRAEPLHENDARPRVFRSVGVKCDTPYDNRGVPRALFTIIGLFQYVGKKGLNKKKQLLCEKKTTRVSVIVGGTRTRNSLSAAHSFSVNFWVRAFCGSSSAPTTGVDSVGLVLESVSGVTTTLDMMGSE